MLSKVNALCEVISRRSWTIDVKCRLVTSLLISLITEPHGIRRETVDFKYHIHCLETEAYSSILMAFIAQSDLLSWVNI